MANLKVKEGISTSSSKEVSLKPGQIIMHYGSSAPSGFILCDGTELLKTSYQSLFDQIGIVYGETNGSGGVGTTHFRVPNLVNNFMVPRGTGVSTSGGASSHSHTVTANVNVTPKDVSHTHTTGTTNSGAFAWNHGHNASNAANGGAYGTNPVNANKTGNLGSSAISGSGHQHPTWTNVNWGYNADGNDVSESHGHTMTSSVNTSNNLVATVVNATNQVSHAHNATTTFTTNTSGLTNTSTQSIPYASIIFCIKV